MKVKNTGLTFLCGGLLGVSLTLGLAAAEKSITPPKKNFSHLQITGYPNGATGILDTDTGTLFIYDGSQVNCIAIREITTLGASMRRVRN